MKACGRCIFKHFVFKKSSQGEWLMKISQLRNLILQSIDAWYLKTLTSYPKIMVAPVSLTYRYESHSI